MIQMSIYVKIMDLKKQGLKKLQVANYLEVDVKTIRKYWDMTPKDYAEYVRDCSKRMGILSPYDRFIVDKLRQFPDVSAAQIYDWLRETYKDFKPAESTVRLHVRNLREREGILKRSRIRQYEAVEELPFGLQAQVDMGSEWIVDAHEKRIKVYAFCMSLSSSRMKYVVFQRKPYDTVSFIYAHQLAFEYFGGRTKEIVYDQDRVLCVSENAGNLILTEKFQSFVSYSGFSVRLCRGYDPESKGKIEAVVKFVKNNFLKHRIFYGIDTLNSSALEWLDRTGNGLNHNTTKIIPKLAFKEERKFLIPVPAMENVVKPKAYLVRKDNVISYRSNRYALPTGTYAPGRKVFVKEDENNLIITDEHGNVVISHTICMEKGRLIRIRHPDRPYIKHQALFDTVLSLLGGTEQAKAYLLKSRELYPRYMRDNFKAFQKAVNDCTDDERKQALNYCAERELFHSSDFIDTLVYFSQLEPEPYVPDTYQIPDKYASVVAQERDLSAYTKIYGGKS